MSKSEKVKINVKGKLEDNTIDLSLSDLSEVPVKEIAAIKRVTILDLSSNKLIYLPKTFPSLVNLTKLDLSKNQIRFLPDDFGNLKNLRHLNLYNNRMEYLPFSFGNLNTLRYLDLKANPLTPALAKIVGPCLTTKDCNESAKNTVKFLSQMRIEVEWEKQKMKEKTAKIEFGEEKKSSENQKTKKSKKNRSKTKKNKSESNSKFDNENPVKNKIGFKTQNTEGIENVHQKPQTVFKTILAFLFMLVLNILMLYIITVKNPDIAERLVKIIPVHYREVIISKSEDVRSNFFKATAWLPNFRSG